VGGGGVKHDGANCKISKKTQQQRGKLYIYDIFRRGLLEEGETGLVELVELDRKSPILDGGKRKRGRR